MNAGSVVSPAAATGIEAATSSHPAKQRTRTPNEANYTHLAPTLLSRLFERLPFPCLMPALASAALLWACYFPLAWGWLGWIALIPLIALARSTSRPRNIYWSAYLGGLAFFLCVLTWMTVADYRMVYTWLMLSFYCAIYFPVGLRIIRGLDRVTGWPLTWTVPIAWVGLEFIRSFALTGFAWYYLGHTQHSFVQMVQIADLGGVYAISFIMAAFQGWVVEWLCRGSLAPVRRLWIQGGVVASLVVAALFYGGWRLHQRAYSPGPVVALLQGNMDQRLRLEAFEEANPDTSKKAPEKRLRKAFNIQQYYGDLYERAIIKWSPDLVVWPETSYPFIWPKAPADRNLLPDERRDEILVLQEYIKDQVRKSRTAHLLGLNTLVWLDAKKYKQYNAAFLLNADGNYDGHYDKIHRVPFGEYVPFRDWLPLMNALAPYDFDYSISQGEKMTRLPIQSRYVKDRTFHFGSLICYEDTDPFLGRQYGRDHEDGPPVDFLVNISNDGWFDGSSEHDEHLAISRFRAIECRRSLVRAVNMGISAVIDGNGRVLKPREVDDVKGMKFWAVLEEGGEFPELPLSEWRSFKKVGGVLTASVPIDNRYSLYAHLGDWLPGLCWLVILGVAIGSRWTRGRVQVKPA